MSAVPRIVWQLLADFILGDFAAKWGRQGVRLGVDKTPLTVDVVTMLAEVRLVFARLLHEHGGDGAGWEFHLWEPDQVLVTRKITIITVRCGVGYSISALAAGTYEYQ